MQALPELFLTELAHPGKPKLLLLHGLGMAHRMWLPQHDELHKSFHLVIPDLPGMAQSKHLGEFSLPGSASLLLDFLKRQNLLPIHVCGLSLGAMVALEMSLQAEDGELKSLILSGGQVHAPRLLMTFQRVMFTFVSEKRLVTDLAKSIPTTDEEMFRAAQEDAVLTGKEGFLQVLKSAGRADYRNALAAVSVPTLVMCGARDKANLGAAHLLASGIPDAELVIAENAGHVWNVGNPTRFNAEVKQFVEQVEGKNLRTC